MSNRDQRSESTLKCGSVGCIYRDTKHKRNCTNWSPHTNCGFTQEVDEVAEVEDTAREDWCGTEYITVVLSDQLTDTQELIIQECEALKVLLLEKNRKYGDSAINPTRLFSKASPVEQINVRLDDKISRIKSSQSDEDEDVELDILGYLILKRVAKRVAL